MDPRTPNPRPDPETDNVPTNNTNGENNVYGASGTYDGVPTVDPATGAVSTQPVTTDVSSGVPNTPAVTMTPMGQPNIPPLASSEGGSLPPRVSAGGGKRRWILPVACAGVLAVLAGSAYVFGMYLPNRPSAIYATSLERSGKAVDALVEYSDGAAQKDYKTYSIDGKLKVRTSDTSFEATVKGDMDRDANSELLVKANVLGEAIKVDMRTIHVEDSANPDFYIRASGIKPILDAADMNSLSSLDDTWISVDHTLLDGIGSELGMDEAVAEATTLPTNAQLQDALAKIQTVNKQYIFTTDQSKAVLTQSKYVGKEAKNGRSTHHYKVGYNKAHMKSYAQAMISALDSSKLNDWSKAANDGSKISELIDLDDVKSSIDDMKDGYTFDMWVDAETKLVHMLQFREPEDPTSTFTLAQNYTGGDDYPFEMTLGAMADGQSNTASIKMNLNKKTDVVTGDLSLKAGESTGSFKFTVTPSNKKLTVTAPTGATSAMELYNRLSSGSVVSPATSFEDLGFSSF
jgi:hypothetical protein